MLGALWCLYFRSVWISGDLKIRLCLVYVSRKLRYGAQCSVAHGSVIFVFSIWVDHWRFKDTFMSKLRFLESCAMLLGALWCLYFRSVWISGDYNIEYA